MKFSTAEAPAFSEEPQGKHVRVGKTARFDGTVTGIPLPSVEWTKNGQPISDSERVELVGVAKDGEFSLIIKSVEVDDFAEVSNRLSRCLLSSNVLPPIGVILSCYV